METRLLVAARPLRVSYYAHPETQRDRCRHTDSDTMHVKFLGYNRTLSSLSSCMMASISLVSLGLTMNGLTAVGLKFLQVKEPVHRFCFCSFDLACFTKDFELSIYDADRSSTSKHVTCTNDLCTHHDSCNGTSGYCPYYVSYVSSETSTSGILVEDILHLRTLDSDQEFIKAYVTFGCGQVQTGSFLDIAAPNGLFGLGLEKVSVPSTLFREGYMANSFSMCFGHDGTGRINFGDKGSLDQEETPFHTNSFHPTYNVNVTQVRVGTTVLDYEFTALFDSGTSFTYLVDPFYTMLSDSFKSHVRDQQRPPDPRIPFEYCYIMSHDMQTSLIPGMSLTMDGGGQLLVYDPIIVISSPHELVYCLAVVKSQELNIIGLHCGYWAWWVAEGVNDEEHGQISVDNYAIKNFMTGYRIVLIEKNSSLVGRSLIVITWKIQMPPKLTCELC
ncbi:Aspartyl protease family protein 1 [Sesamum angolense]|uniref:Aspartyl protease family protein 1 n=1 Tax=Sesamum angolense TaxID=2727404 RepID=A0AAE2BQA7_9LAMI|nr:Aspartyl protease family protein 1 [Sesamum angolense]